MLTVCGTDRDPLAELGSNLSDWGDQQAMPGAPLLKPCQMCGRRKAQHGCLSCFRLSGWGDQQANPVRRFRA